VVLMTVCQTDCDQLQTILLDDLKHAFRIVAGIDHRGLIRCRITEKITFYGVSSDVAEHHRDILMQ